MNAICRLEYLPLALIHYSIIPWLDITERVFVIKLLPKYEYFLIKNKGAWKFCFNQYFWLETIIKYGLSRILTNYSWKHYNNVCAIMNQNASIFEVIQWFEHMEFCSYYLDLAIHNNDTIAVKWLYDNEKYLSRKYDTSEKLKKIIQTGISFSKNNGNIDMEKLLLCY